jgi:hypothetical protein
VDRELTNWARDWADGVQRVETRVLTTFPEKVFSAKNLSFANLLFSGFLRFC